MVHLGGPTGVWYGQARAFAIRRNGVAAGSVDTARSRTNRTHSNPRARGAASSHTPRTRRRIGTHRSAWFQVSGARIPGTSACFATVAYAQSCQYFCHSTRQERSTMTVNPMAPFIVKPMCPPVGQAGSSIRYECPRPVRRNSSGGRAGQPNGRLARRDDLDGLPFLVALVGR